MTLRQDLRNKTLLYAVASAGAIAASKSLPLRALDGVEKLHSRHAKVP